jgi:hypothetical protein
MAHFARLDENNAIIAVHRVSDVDCCDETGFEKEHVGIAFLRKLWGAQSKWVKTSYNSKIRKNYAYVGGTYDAKRDAFIGPKPFDSWILDENLCVWIAPKPHPEPETLAGINPFKYIWDESVMDWILGKDEDTIDRCMRQVNKVVIEDPTEGDKAIREVGKFGEFVRKDN